MKKIYIMVLAVCMTAGTLNAQKIYVRAGLGGGVGLKQYVRDFWADETKTASTDNFVVKSVGLGGGFNVNAAFGYKMTDNVAIEFGINEFIGLAKKSNQSATGTFNDFNKELKISGMMLQLVPAVVISPGLEKVNPYARLGMIVGVLPSIMVKSSSTNTNSGGPRASTLTEYTMKLHGGVAVGFTAAGGVTFNLSDMLSLYGELVYNGITYAPSKGIYKKYTVDGVDRLADMTTRDKETIYVKKYDANENIADGSPDKAPKESFNFSNVLLNIGVMIKL
ncbi:MAG: outer membrane beta-barrel protein [Bacteroidetes bacterium]|nr:outer membrane beta-barrel protein [Bacteroidota bacterium]